MRLLWAAGIGAMTWSPLACGIISGKYTSGIPPCSRASLKVDAFLGPATQNRPEPSPPVCRVTSG